MQTLGVYGTGLDTNAIISAIVNAEIAPISTRLDRQERDSNITLSSLGALSASLETVETALASLTSGSSFDARSITTPDAVTVTQSGSAPAGRYSMTITDLAQAQSLYSDAFSSASSVIGEGTLTISLGSPSYVSGSSGAYSAFAQTSTVDITIDSSNNSVSGVRDAINSADIGVTASLLLDGDQVRLVVTADDSGAENAISISVTDSDGGNSDSSGLSQLSYGLSGTSGAHVGNLSESRAAQDASFSLNGIPLTSSTNTISGLVDGLDFTLNATTAESIDISVEKNRLSMVDDIRNFVEEYNAFQSSLAESMSYDEVAGAGVFQGDSMMRQLSSSMRSALTDTVSGLSGDFELLSSLGISADRFGQLTIDEAKLMEALASDTAAVQAFFAGDGSTAGMAQRVIDTIDIYTNDKTGLISSREESITSKLRRIEDQRLSVERRAASLQERYIRQFAAMDALVGQLQSTSNFLTNQLSNLPGQNSN